MARILIVDDDPSVRLVVGELLEIERGDHVVTAEDGVAAQELLDDPDEPTPDLVLLDVMMPGMDGFELLAWIRAHDWLFDLPVVMLTAKVGHEDQVTGWSRGCDGYVTKPFEPDQLYETVGLVLDVAPDLRAIRRRERLSELLQIGPQGRQGSSSHHQNVEISQSNG